MVAKVLVVEDDSTVSGVLSAYLRKAGFEPRVAADGPTALQEWRQWLPDVVILDVMLPGLSGLEVLQRRRADDDVAAVIILSARGEEDDRLLGLEMGADDYMVKPFSPRESVLRVQALLRRAERLGSASMLPRTVVSGGADDRPRGAHGPARRRATGPDPPRVRPPGPPRHPPR